MRSAGSRSACSPASAGWCASAQLLEHLRAARVDGGLVGQAVVDQALRVERDDRGVRLDALDLQRLRVGGLVGLVVTEAAVADEVDQDVAPEALAEGHRQAHRAAAGVDGIRVDVDDRDVEALGEIGRVARRARVVRVRREADLVVRDHVQRAADAVARQRLQVERLRHDALAGEGRVAVDRDRERAARVGGRVAALLIGLQRAHAARSRRGSRTRGATGSGAARCRCGAARRAPRPPRARRRRSRARSARRGGT